VPGEHDGEPRQGQTDPDFVESQSEWSVGTETHIGRHQEECTGGERVASAGDGDRYGEGQDALGQ
jgi:hypothetical protein